MRSQNSPLSNLMIRSAQTTVYKRHSGEKNGGIHRVLRSVNWLKIADLPKMLPWQ